MGQFCNEDVKRIGRAVRFTEKVSTLRGQEQIRRGMTASNNGQGQFQGMINDMQVTQNQTGSSYLFAHELL